MVESENAEATRSHEFCFNDFEVGRTSQMSTYTATGEKILTFTLQYDPQPFRIDVEAARHSVHGGIVSNGWMTCSIMIRLMVTGFLGKAASMDSSNVDEIRWMEPAYPRDTLSVSNTRMEVHPSQSEPDCGVAVNRWEARNQHGELVRTVTGMGLLGHRPKI